MNKAELRKNMITILNKITEIDRNKYEKAVLTKLLQTELWKEARTIGITISNGFEWNTTEIIQEAWKQKKFVTVPKCHPKSKTMDFYKIESFEQLEVVYYNLQEPKPDESELMSKHSIDLLIVPGLVYDKRGYRIGFGGGFYDRFMTGFSNKTLSLLHPSQLVNELPIQQHDINVDYLLTAKGFINKK